MMNTPYMGYNPYTPNITSQQRLAMMEAQYPQYAQQQMPVQQAPTQQNPAQTNKIFPVASLQEAQNAQIAMDGTVSYFAFGDTILARNWSFATGKIENTTYKKVVEDVPTEEEPKEDRLKVIEEKIDTLITQSKYPINKSKGVTNKDGE